MSLQYLFNKYVRASYSYLIYVEINEFYFKIFTRAYPAHIWEK